jgi:hypothetical protein
MNTKGSDLKLYLCKFGHLNFLDDLVSELLVKLCYSKLEISNRFLPVGN